MSGELRNTIYCSEKEQSIASGRHVTSLARLRCPRQSSDLLESLCGILLEQQEKPTVI